MTVQTAADDLCPLSNIAGVDAGLTNPTPAECAGLTRNCSRTATIVDLEANVALGRNLTIVLGNQNVFSTPLERTDPFAYVFGLPYRQFTPWGLSRGYYLCATRLELGPPDRPNGLRWSPDEGRGTGRARRGRERNHAWPFRSPHG